MKKNQFLIEEIRVNLKKAKTRLKKKKIKEKTVIDKIKSFQKFFLVTKNYITQSIIFE